MSLNNLMRSRRNSIARDKAAETRLSPEDFVQPYFVVEGYGIKRGIESMPGIHRLSIDNLLKDIDASKGLKAILLFGITKKKDVTGSESYNGSGVVQQTVKAVKKEFSGLTVITDVCLCGYTSHGHCGIIGDQKSDSFIDDEKTLKILSEIALSHAEAGSDIVAPSAMMTGQVEAIRIALDGKGFKEVSILGYSAKYASNFYGPFRDIMNSAPQFGDRKTYQMDFRNSDEALEEIEQDITEGADIVMVKPALAYLDIIYRAKQNCSVPIAAYNVSGEYSMIKKMSGDNKEIEEKLAIEVLTSIKRAGADIIISYFSRDAIRWLK